MRNNNFDLIRLIVATQVAVSHVSAHLNYKLPAYLKFMGYFPGVPIFFIISGFLISASLELSPLVRQYALNRFLRIYPALWVCLAFSIVILLLSGVSVSSSEFAVWLLAQSSIVQFYNPDFLRGYGVGVLNGSLWTIPVELQFYILLPILAWLVGKGRNQVMAWGCLLLISLPIMMVYQHYFSEQTNILSKVIHVSLAPYLFYFLVGLILRIVYERSDFFNSSFYLFLVAYFILVLVQDYFKIANSGGNNLNPVQILALGCIVVSAAFTRAKLSENILRGNDISYGTYIYHMPIVNYLIY